MSDDQANSTEFIWACGLFEGEGHWPARGRQMKLGMVDLDVVERFQRAIGGVGSIYSFDHGSGRKMMHYWTVSRWDHAEPLTRRMLPMLGKRRREQAEKYLANPPNYIVNIYETGFCRKGHELAVVGMYLDSGRWRCGECKRESHRRWYRRAQSRRMEGQMSL